MTQTLSGQIRRIVYRNEQTGYVVATLAADGGPATIVGSLLDLTPGAAIRAEGEWLDDPRHGRQFRVAAYEHEIPSDRDAIARYLGSGLIKGVGPALAEALVAKFGERVFDVIENKPQRLRDVPGIGRQKAAAIRDAWTRLARVKELGLLLQRVGAPRQLAVRIIETLGEDAPQRVKDDPYVLVGRVRGVGFLTADRIAGHLGVARDDPDRLRAGLRHVVAEAAGDGHTVVIVAEAIHAAAQLLAVEESLVDPQVEALVVAGELKRDELAGDPVLAIPDLYAAERHLAEAFAAIASAESRFRRIDEARAVAWVEERLDIALADQQRIAVVGAIAHPLTVITGGPGTGKTTIVRAICEIGEALKRTVALCAPTGRAAKRLGEATGRPAKTVHRLLEFNPALHRFERGPVSPLAADMIVCDEASMLDVHVALYLTEAVAAGAHLVLVGDSDQLPSVGPGTVLADLIACPWVPTFRLDKIFRQAAASRIVIGAHDIRHGRLPELSGGRDSDFFFLQEEDPAALADLVVDLAARRLPEAYGLDPFEDIMVLAPMHRGEVGVASLNDRLRDRLNPVGPEMRAAARLWRVGDKVMQTANDYDNDIFNGDLGRIVRVAPGAGTLVATFDGRPVSLGASELADLAPAFAVSIHKSQGSEYPAVVVPLHTQHYIMLARNLLYTAVTRGKRLVVLCGTRRALERAVANDTAQRRRTLLGKRLAEYPLAAKT